MHISQRFQGVSEYFDISVCIIEKLLLIKYLSDAESYIDNWKHNRN